MLTLVSGISCTLFSAVCLCAEGTTKANNPSVSPLGMVFTYNIPFLMVKLFLMRNSALPSSESECSPMHVLSKASLFWGVTSFLVLIHLWQVANSTSSPLCFLPIGHVHRCQLEGAGLCFFQAITFHSQGLADEDLSSLSCQLPLLPGEIIPYLCHVALALG